ncbi:hypothetical protein JL720_8774 [Aureococcus anophagefferens]|nr:hypothetical protein JL720_8774 [Aureococcus anophagefferens]
MMMKGLLHSCAHCGVAAEKSYRCSGCKQVTYCSKACQRGDWPEHKIQCESVEEALLAKSGEGDRNVGAAPRRGVAAAALQALVALAWLLGATGALTVVDRCAGKLLALAGATVGRSGPVTLWSLGLLVASIIARSAAGQALLRRAKILASAGVAVYELRRARKYDDEHHFKSCGIFVARTVVELGGLWVKTATYASARLDVLPRALALELAHCADRVHRAEAYAPASDDQGGDTIQVALKLARPGVDVLFEADLRLLYFLVWLATESFEAGFRVDDVGELEEHKIAKAAVFRRLAAALAHGIFAEGLFHGDPHAGNVLVRPNPEQADGFDLVLLDGGAVERLDDDAPAKRSLHRAAASMRRSAPSFSDVPPLCPASPPGAAARPADDTGFFVVRGRRVSGLEWIRSRAGDARAALRRAARVCAYHDVALIRISPEEPEPGQPDEDDDDDEGDFDDMSSFDSVFDSELLQAL